MSKTDDNDKSFDAHESGRLAAYRLMLSGRAGPVPGVHVRSRQNEHGHKESLWRWIDRTGPGADCKRHPLDVAIDHLKREYGKEQGRRGRPPEAANKASEAAKIKNLDKGATTAALVLQIAVLPEVIRSGYPVPKQVAAKLAEMGRSIGVGHVCKLLPPEMKKPRKPSKRASPKSKNSR